MASIPECVSTITCNFIITLMQNLSTTSLSGDDSKMITDHSSRLHLHFFFTITDIASGVSSGVRIAEIAVWAKKTIFPGWDREMPVYGCASVVLYHISRWPGQPIPSRNGQTPSENRLKSFYFNFIVTTACTDAAFACSPAEPSSSSRKETLECSSYRSLTSPGMTAKSQRPFWWNSGPKGFSSSKFKHFLNEVSD